MPAQLTMTATEEAAGPRVANPYAKPVQNAVNNIVNMGRQSQQRVSNQHKRKFKLASPVRRRKGDQLTLDNKIAFDPLKDCRVCKAQEIKKFMPSYPVPKRAHDDLCPKNAKTQGLGKLTEQSIASLADNKRYKTITAPIRPEERFNGRHNTKEAATVFFAARNTTATTTTTKTMTEVDVAKSSADEAHVSPTSLSKAVGKLVSDPAFQERHKSKMAPLAMLAFATEISQKIINNKDKSVLCQHFDGIEMVVPVCHDHNNPHYHSISGMKLLYVNWERTHGIQVPCPDSNCAGTLGSGSVKGRSNFSKNQTLFPMFGLDGSPTWCIVTRLECPCCKRKFNSNEADVLVNLPEHAASTYPVETTHAQPNYNCHLTRNATEVFATIIVTYGNGELCSKLLFNSINRDYIQRLKIYYSMAKQTKGPIEKYPTREGTFIKAYPPLGESVRDMYDTASSSQKNPWCISDHEKHIREIQSVKTDSIWCQDHTFQVVKNYTKKVGAKAVWDAATGTEEIASAMLVPSTKTEDFAHAAQQLFEEARLQCQVQIL